MDIQTGRETDRQRQMNNPGMFIVSFGAVPSESATVSDHVIRSVIPVLSGELKRHGHQM